MLGQPHLAELILAWIPLHSVAALSLSCRALRRAAAGASEACLLQAARTGFPADHPALKTADVRGYLRSAAAAGSRLLEGRYTTQEADFPQLTEFDLMSPDLACMASFHASSEGPQHLSIFSFPGLKLMHVMQLPAVVRCCWGKLTRICWSPDSCKLLIGPVFKRSPPPDQTAQPGVSLLVIDSASGGIAMKGLLQAAHYHVTMSSCSCAGLLMVEVIGTSPTQPGLVAHLQVFHTSGQLVAQADELAAKPQQAVWSPCGTKLLLSRPAGVWLWNCSGHLQPVKVTDGSYSNLHWCPDPSAGLVLLGQTGSLVMAVHSATEPGPPLLTLDAHPVAWFLNGLAAFVHSNDGYHTFSTLQLISLQSEQARVQHSISLPGHVFLHGPAVLSPDCRMLLLRVQSLATDVSSLLFVQAATGKHCLVPFWSCRGWSRDCRKLLLCTTPWQYRTLTACS